MIQPLEFEHALHEVVMGLGCRVLGPLLNVRPGYLRRQANPHDNAVHFRARDLGATLGLARQRLSPDLALLPLEVLARSLGCALYPIPQVTDVRSVIISLGSAARAFGDLGSHSAAAVDPRGDGGHTVTRSELVRIEGAGFRLTGRIAQIMATSRKLCPAPRPGGQHV